MKVKVVRVDGEGGSADKHEGRSHTIVVSVGAPVRVSREEQRAGHGPRYGRWGAAATLTAMNEAPLS